MFEEAWSHFAAAAPYFSFVVVVALDADLE
jgi:hypothetical protein